MIQPYREQPLSQSATLAQAASTQAAALPRAAAPAAAQIRVEVAGAGRLAEIQDAWRDLVARADAANVFMHPLLVALGARHADARCVTLLGWRDSGGRRRLVGLWAFNVGHAPRSILPISVLAAPPFAHAYLAAPVIDRNVLDETLQVMLDAIADDPALPNILALDGMPADGPAMQALARVLAARGSKPYHLRRSARPMLACNRDAALSVDKMLSASTRKKLRQHRRRLAEKGALEATIIAEPEAVGRAVEDFLTLEAAGWKGRERSALLCNPRDAAFTREIMAALAPHGEAWIHALTLDGVPVSMQIVLRAGATAFTWKTAYDERLRDFSPGMLLLEDYTSAFLADPRIATVDSCAYDETSFMAVWDGRQAMTELWLDARRGGSPAFAQLSRLQDAYLRLRAQAKAIHARLRRRG